MLGGGFPNLFNLFGNSLQNGGALLAKKEEPVFISNGQNSSRSSLSGTNEVRQILRAAPQALGKSRNTRKERGDKSEIARQLLGQEYFR